MSTASESDRSRGSHLRSGGRRAGRDAVTGGGVSQLVAFEEVDAAASVQSQISANFLTKYAADGFAGAVNEDMPLGATLRLLPL